MSASAVLCQDVVKSNENYQKNANIASLNKLIDSLALDEAIRIALKNNPGIIAADNEAQGSGHRVKSLKSERYPNIDGQTDYRNFLYNQRLIQGRKPRDWASPFTKNIASLDIILTIPLYTSGRLSNEIKAAELLHNASILELAHSKNELIFNISSLYFSILAQHNVVTSLEISKQAIMEHLKTINQMIDVKKAAVVDRLRADVRLSDLEQLYIREKNILAIEYSALSNLMGLDVGQGIQSLEDSLQVKDAVICPMVSECYSRALENRKDYCAILSELQGKEAQIHSAQALRYPSVYLKGNLSSRLDASRSDSREEIIDYYGNDGMLGIVLIMPLFDGGGITAHVRERQTEYEAKKQQIRQLELKIYNEVYSSRLSLEAARDRITATEKSIEEAKESFRIEQEKYSLGSGTVVDVLDAQSALLQAQTNYYHALAEWNISLAQLRFFTGEGEF